DLLGPGAHRFFGAGFKRASQELHDVRTARDPAGTVRVTGRAAVAYPDDWSRKGSQDQAPHLSTVDVMRLSAQVAAVLLTATPGLDAAASWLRGLRIRAGTAPVEQALRDFPVSAEVRDTSGPHQGRAVSTVYCQVGNMTAELEIDHDLPDRSPGTIGPA